MDSQFSQISFLLVIAATLALIVRKLKQPILIGYLLAGLLISVFGIISDISLPQSLGKIGVTLLLFLVGLEMNPKEIKTVGKVSLLTGIGQIVITFVLAFFLGLALSFSVITSAYLAIAVSFSSTIIIVKLLSEKNATGSLHGKIAIGFLLVQDFVAIILLIFLSGISKGGLNAITLLSLFIKGILLMFVTWILAKKILPVVYEKYVADSQELIFIVSIAWALGYASFVALPMGFSMEIGGFLAGIALSGLPEHLEIASKTRSLRDFFLTLFFLSMGMSMKVNSVGVVLFPAFVFSLLVLFGKPIIMMMIMGLLKFKKRTSFLASVSVAQISEFSLIVVAMGYSLGHLDESIVTMIVIIAALTMTTSTYFIMGAEKIYPKLKDKLSIFEKKNAHDINFEKTQELNDHIVLIGCYRTGQRILTLLKRIKYQYLIIDFNPDVYSKLNRLNYPVVFGDIADPEILVKAKIEKAKLVISTIDSLSDNMVLLEYIKRFKNKPQTIMTSVTRKDAIKLYEYGASYIIVPDITAGEYLRHILGSYGVGSERFIKLGKNHYRRLIGA